MSDVANRYGCEPEPRSEGLGSGIEHLTWECPAVADVKLVLASDDGHGAQETEDLGHEDSAGRDLRHLTLSPIRSGVRSSGRP